MTRRIIWKNMVRRVFHRVISFFKTAKALPVIVAFLVLSAACKRQSQPDTEPNSGNDAASRPAEELKATASSNKDSDFIASAYVESLGAMELYDHAYKMITNQGLKDMAEGLQKAHTDLMSRLKKLAAEKHITLPNGLPENKSEPLFEHDDKSGPEFDKAFATKVMEDHKKAIGMYQSAINESQDPSVKEFCKSFLPQLEGHLKLASDLRDKINPKDYSLSK